MGAIFDLEQAFSILDQSLSDRKMAKTKVNVDDSLHRILSDPVYSLLNIPSFNRASMDGYGIIAHDIRQEYKVVHTIYAGEYWDKLLNPGEAVRIMTGAPLPENCGRIIKQEDTDRGINTVNIREWDDHTYFSESGQDLKEGDRIFKEGHILDAPSISALKSCGITEIMVYENIRTLILVTGDELVDNIKEMAPGKIMDSNLPMLSGLCLNWHGFAVNTQKVQDDLCALVSALEKGAKSFDLLIISGGASVGERDFVPAALAQTGFQMKFDKISVKPGKPTIFARKGPAIALALPGNPVSAFLGFHLFALRIKALMTESNIPFMPNTVELAQDISFGKWDRDNFVPCKIDENGGANPVEYHGSAHILAATGACGFIRVPKGVKRAEKGTKLRFYRYAL